MNDAPNEYVLVLWDIDRTLIESDVVGKELLAEAFSILTGRTVTKEFTPDGGTDPSIMEELLRLHDIVPTKEHCIQLSAALSDAMESKTARLQERGHAMLGARDALATLSNSSRVVQSVLTGNIKVNAIKKLALFGLDSYIDFDIGGFGSDDPVRSNLVAVAQNRARTKYNAVFSHKNTVLIGDTVRDVQAGLGGGAFVVGVAAGAYSPDALRRAGAHVVLDDLRDTAQVVDSVASLRNRSLS